MLMPGRMKPWPGISVGNPYRGRHRKEDRMTVTSELFTAGFWITTVTRTVRGAAAAAIGALGVGATDIASIPWYAVLSAAGFGAASSLLASLAEVKATDAVKGAAFGLLGPQSGPPRRVVLRGPRGPQGEAGRNGERGGRGMAGQEGPSGGIGLRGIPGLAGERGAPGGRGGQGGTGGDGGPDATGEPGELGEPGEPGRP